MVSTSGFGNYRDHSEYVPIILDIDYDSTTGLSCGAARDRTRDKSDRSYPACKTRRANHSAIVPALLIVV